MPLHPPADCEYVGCSNALPLERDGRQKFCSAECRRRANNERYRDPAKPIKRRGPRPKYPRETHCLQCGVKLTGMRRRFCSEPCAEAYSNESRKTGASDEWHRLSDIDEEARTAVCSKCGPGASIHKAGRWGWKCRVSVRTAAYLKNQRESGWRKRGIDLTMEQYESMLVAQSNACAICVRPFETRSPHVDHCHTGGHVRGLLCDDCNLGLGKFGDDPARLDAAAAYLRSYITKERQMAN